MKHPPGVKKACLVSRFFTVIKGDRNRKRYYLSLITFKGQVHSKIKFNLTKRIKNSKQNSENLMKIGCKIRKLWIFEFLLFFRKTVLEQSIWIFMSELMMSCTHNFPHIIYTEMTKIFIFFTKTEKLSIMSTQIRLNTIL